MELVRKSIQIVIFLVCLCNMQLCCSQTETAHTQTIKGKVIHVLDGDTYEMLVEGNQTIRVRMKSIDAPEKGQDYSKKATNYLKSLLIGKIVTVKFKEVEQFGRVLGYTYTEQGEEIGKEMVKAGYAWHFKRFCQDTVYSNLEKAARSQRLGLWADDYPVEPWFERKLRKKGYKSIEIKQLKRKGMIQTEEAVKRLPRNGTQQKKNED